MATMYSVVYVKVNLKQEQALVVSHDFILTFHLRSTVIDNDKKGMKD